MIDLRDDHMALVRRILAEQVPECEVRAFGSRVTWTAGDNSDLDLVVVGAGKLDWRTMAGIRDAFEESMLPFRVDLLDWHAIPESFRKNILKEYEVIQKPIMRGIGYEKFVEHIKIDGVERHRRSWVVEGDWLEYKLVDLCDSIDYGFTTSAKDKPIGPKFLRITDIVSGYIDWDTVPYCENDQANTEKYLLHDKDIVIARTGANTGSSMFISVPPEAIFASYLVRLRISEKAHSRFVSYFLKSPAFWAYMQGVLGDKSAQPNASAKTMTQVKLRLPPLYDQHAIAHILGSLDDKIELNRRMNKTLEAMARAIFKSWFVDFDPVRARRGELPFTLNLPPEILNLFPDSFEDSELGEIPRGWVKTTLGSEVNFLTGFPFKSKYFTGSPPGIRLARGMNIKEGDFYWKSQTRYWPNTASDIEQYLLQSGDVLIGMDGSKVGRNWVRVRAHNLPCLLVQRVTRLRKKESIGENFLWIMVGGERFRSYIDAVKTDTSIPHISGDQIKSYEFLRPPAENDRIFEKFESTVAPLIQKADINVAESELLGQIRDILLPKLISGELRIPNAEKFIAKAGV